MIFRIRSKPHVSLESVALADIVTNLFIFFFVAFGLFATFDAAQKGTLPIQLPRSEHAATQKTESPLVITIDRSGTPSLGPRKIVLSELKKFINYELSSRKEKNVIVRADRSISLEQFVSVLDVIRTTEARAVAIETEL